MLKRKLGRTGLLVSTVGFGGIPIIARPKVEAVKVVRHAYELGINYFDAARAYGDCEEKIGEALKDVRDDVIMATKTHQRTKGKVAIRHSIRNLQTDRIDLVQLQHIDDEKTLKKVMSSDGSLTALKEARSKGVIDFIGITGHNPHVLSKAIRTGEFDTLSVVLNILDRRAAENLIPLAREMDVGVIIMKALGGSVSPLQFPQREASFLGKPKLDWPNASEFIKYFGSDGIERAKRCLRFVLSHDIDTVIPGLRSVEEVDLAVKVSEEFKGLSEEEKRLYRFGKSHPEPFCRECGLCSCPEGIRIPTILRWDRYSTFYGINNWTKEQYDKLNVKISFCTGCGECEKKCPFNLPVVKMLKDAESRLT